MKKFILRLKNINGKELLNFVSKISPFLTLIFLVYSYYNSVKPIFDKTNELNNSKDEIKLLSEKINLKEIELKNFTSDILKLKKESSLLKFEITSLNLEKEKLQENLIENQSELEKKNRSLLSAKESAIKAHLEKMKNEIFGEYLNAESNGQKFNSREFTKSYAEKIQTKDEYELEAKKVLMEYSEYKGQFDIENSIFFLTIFYDYVYLKK